MQIGTFDKFLLQENRKLQFTYNGIHVNFQTISQDKNELLSKKYLELGNLSIICKIKDDSEGIYSPAVYEVEDVQLIAGNLPDGAIIKYLFSFMGLYSNIAKNGDKIFAQGQVLKIFDGKKVMYGLSVSPWKNNFTNRIQVI